MPGGSNCELHRAALRYTARDQRFSPPGAAHTAQTHHAPPAVEPLFLMMSELEGGPAQEFAEHALACSSSANQPLT